MADNNDVLRRISKLESKNEKTDDRYLEIEKSLVEIKLLLKNVMDIEKRVDKLEKQRAWQLGAVAVIVFVIQFLPTIIDYIQK